MKKLFAWVLVLILIVSAMSALAEERFSVRNVVFGMPLEEVKSIEENENSNNVENYFGDSSKALFYIGLPIAGIENGDLYYNFGDENKLNYIYYGWKDEWSSSGITKNSFELKDESEIEYKFKNNYDIINNKLEEKYEKIGYIDNDNTIKYIEVVREDNNTRIQDRLQREKKHEYTLRYEINNVLGFNQYIAKDGEDYVIIEVLCFKREFYNENIIGSDELTGMEYEIYVEYLPFSNEEYTKLIDKANQIEEQRNSDL